MIDAANSPEVVQSPVVIESPQIPESNVVSYSEFLDKMHEFFAELNLIGYEGNQTHQNADTILEGDLFKEFRRGDLVYGIRFAESLFLEIVGYLKLRDQESGSGLTARTQCYVEMHNQLIEWSDALVIQEEQ